MTRFAACLALALAALAACAPPPPGAPGPRGPYDGTALALPGSVLSAHPRPAAPRRIAVAEATAAGEELAFVQGLLTRLQRRSFAENREFCGYVGLDRAGRIVGTRPMPGNEAACPLPDVPAGMRVLASYHTHGTYSPYYASEWPTTQDMATDASDDIDGYIATPGGRLWHVDTDTMTTRLVCGRACLPQDPNYVAAEDGPLRATMTYRDLLIWENTPVAFPY